jgi:uncharacterized protein (DUF1330 family)
MQQENLNRGADVMRCFFIAQITIHDHVKYDKYLAGFDEVFNRFKGEVLAVDDQVTILEGNWPYSRTVVLGFADKSEALNWYHSTGYQKLAKHRWQAATANIVLVEAEE